MISLASPLIALLAGASAPGASCADFPEDPVTVVPDGATAALGLDVDAFAKTEVGKALLPALGADLEFAEAIEVLDDCALSLERTYALTAARDGGDGRAVIIQARAIGEDATLRCLADELRARSDGAEPWTRGRVDCAERLELADGSRAWIPNPYTLVWARGAFVDPVEAVVTGARDPAVPASLSEELGRVDRKAQLWLAVQLSAEDRRALSASADWAREATSVAASVDFSKGLQARMSFAAGDIESLVSLRERVVAGLLGLAKRLDDWGVEHQMREHAAVGIVDEVVAAELSLTAAELRSIRKHVGERVRGRGPL